MMKLQHRSQSQPKPQPQPQPQSTTNKHKHWRYETIIATCIYVGTSVFLLYGLSLQKGIQNGNECDMTW